MSYQIRLNKYIASSDITSRRGADELIKTGKVKINGEVITNPATIITNRDSVEVNGKKIKPLEHKYVIFNKPAGYITARRDPHERKTIYDLLPPEIHKLKPAGRLDRESTGLLILTNDGDLIQKLTHPKGLVPKVYRVTVEGKITQQDLFNLKKGIEIEEGKIAYAEAVILEYIHPKTTLEMTLYQGYNRQIRRMMSKIGHPVISLKRIAHANITLTGLDKGKYRYLSRKEVDYLSNYLKKLNV
ncbi:MAG: hypothetical protein A2255_04605 [Candidatus Melainabacteria bacterium RIFOXYA2_FULL_32_9]|nr:MAG: hypothetical protein A2255_04605 [Candidatus Melainabacteria bacterium RIFOXYA2_FULL_32_9]